MASLTRIGSLSMTVGSMLVPAVKLISGLWFLKSSAELLWKCVKPIRDQILKTRPRFISGRVDKFYKFTPTRVRQRRERKKKEHERKKCRRILFLADNVEDDRSKVGNPSIENEEIDINLLVGLCFSLCTSKCCLALTHAEDEDVGRDEAKDMLKLGGEYSAIDYHVGKADANVDVDPTEKYIHEKMVEDIGLKCISGDSGDPHSHASKSPSYQAHCMTSTLYLSAMQVTDSLACSSILEQDGLYSPRGEAMVTLDDESSLCLSSPNIEKVNLASQFMRSGVSTGSEALSKNGNVKMSKEEVDCTDEIPIEDLFKPFATKTEEVDAESNDEDCL